jgi:hypothetical protein
MIKNKNKILILGFIGVLIIGFGSWDIVKATGSSVYISPAQVSKEIGNVFDITVKVDPDGQKVCAVEGKLNLTKLSCQKVTMGSNLSAQKSPSCDDLNFLLGIEGCTTSKKTLFTIKVKASSVGSGAAKFTEVDIMGEGTSVGLASTGGNYTITAVPTSASIPTPILKLTPKSTLPSIPTPILKTTTPEITIPETTTLETTTLETTTLETTIPETTIPETTTLETTTPEITTSETTITADAEQVADLAEVVGMKFFLASLGDVLLNPITIWIIVILGALIALYFVGRKFYRKK